MVGGDPENLNQSGSVQRASNEESEETDPSEELSKQSSSGQRTSNEKSNVKVSDFWPLVKNLNLDKIIILCHALSFIGKR